MNSTKYSIIIRGSVRNVRYVLNRLKLDNHYLWGKFQGDMTKEMVSREQKWIEVVNFVKSLGIPNCIKDKKGLLKVWASWKYQFNKKEVQDKTSGAPPVKWTECDELIRDIIGGNIQHRKKIKVCLIDHLKIVVVVTHNPEKQTKIPISTLSKGVDLVVFGSILSR